MSKILIIEDDPHINELLKDLLTLHGYTVTQAFSGTEGLMAFGSGCFNLVLLDLMLPGLTGDVVLATIRNKSQTPILILTATGNKEKTVELLRLGANDYIVKPFNNAELMARIEIWLRQNNEPNISNLTFKDIMINLETMKVEVAGIEVNLSKREYKILECLMKYPKKVFTKANLYESVWEDSFMGDENTINVHISNIRNKLAKASPNEDYIQTVWGIGFKLSES